jgi:predicted small lipoprotein YifL
MRYGIILLILMASGCGQKGALYLPNEKPQQSVSADSRISVAPVNAKDSKKP